jgi:DNA-binding transcriptional LysR family regulator
MHTMDIKWDDLHTLLSVSRAGSFLGAARDLAVEHTTVARRVIRLERSLGNTLLHRGRRGVTLTPFGEALVKALARTEGEVRAAVRISAEQDPRVGGTVRIATSEIFAVAFLCGRLPGLKERYPALDVQVLTSQAPVDLARGQADIAVRMLPPGRAPGEGDVLARRVGAFDFALYGARSYLAGRPIGPDGSLRGHQLVAYVGVPRAPGAEWLAARNEGAGVALSASSVPVVSAAAEAGMGLAILPAFYADQRPNLVRLSGPVAESVVWLLIRPEMKRSRHVAAVHRWLADVIPEGLRRT